MAQSETMLTFNLSDENEFHCSACGDAIASLGNGRFMVSGLPDLISLFRRHVGRYHNEGDAQPKTFNTDI